MSDPQGSNPGENVNSSTGASNLGSQVQQHDQQVAAQDQAKQQEEKPVQSKVKNKEPTSPKLWLNRVFCAVTGASKGFGRALCVEFARNFLTYHKQNQTQGEYKLTFLLLARDAALLDEFQAQINALDPEGHVQAIEPIAGPVEKDTTIQSFDQAMVSFGGYGEKFDQAILVHNAGSLGNPNKLVTDYTKESSEELSRYFEINVLSAIKMTGAFLKSFHHTKHRILINVSSLCAVKPFKGLSLYCTGKAARDAYFRNVHEEDPNTYVINYAPGPLLTDMAKELQTDGYLREFYKNESNLLKAETSAAKLVSILTSNKAASGMHVDFYDYGDESA